MAIATPEELGQALAASCLAFLNEHNENPPSDESVYLEGVAFIFVLHRIAIEFLGPEDRETRVCVYTGFDRALRGVFRPDFLEWTNQRGPYYGKCIRENWGGGTLGLSLSLIFNQFCRGSEHPGVEPIRLNDGFDVYASYIFASQTFKAVFGVCSGIIDGVELQESDYEAIRV
ncbi:hypothetical protein [Aeoliella sp. SH292]|uniref:hypothetical protein n=1 Tax=Aeoliella sp. SH292 TaxID=3454464 RepID=UPI003F9CC094